MDNALGEVNSLTEKRKALEAQLPFRQKMLKQTYKKKDVFRFSEKGKKHTINKLKENLTKLIEEAYHGPTEEKLQSRAPLIVGKRVTHRFEDAEYMGNVISVVPGFVNFYNIVYDKDVGADGITQTLYTYKLLEDYRNGDLDIILEVTVMLLLEFVTVNVELSWRVTRFQNNGTVTKHVKLSMCFPVWGLGSSVVISVEFLGVRV